MAVPRNQTVVSQLNGNSLLNPVINSSFDPFKQGALQQSQSIETSAKRQSVRNVIGIKAPGGLKSMNNSTNSLQGGSIKNLMVPQTVKHQTTTAGGGLIPGQQRSSGESNQDAVIFDFKDNNTAYERLSSASKDAQARIYQQQKERHCNDLMELLNQCEDQKSTSRP